MNTQTKKILYIVLDILFIICFIIVCFSAYKSQKQNKSTENSITIGQRKHVNQLVKINIEGTNDFVKITKQVKFDVPNSNGTTTVSFSLPVEYTINVDGINYNGIFELGDSAGIQTDKNPKYNFEVTNLTPNGDIEILLNRK